MKIKLKNTKLADTNKNPLPFFHSTPCEKIERFLPLSHFGTQAAAHMRSMHFIYRSLGIQEPAILPKAIPFQLLKKFNQQKDAPKLQMQKVYLAMKSPLKIPDLTHHSVEQYYRWFSDKYAPKSQYLSGSERCEGDVVGSARTKYKKVLSNFIFLDPFVQSESDLKKEIKAESFYDVTQEEKVSPNIPSFLFPVASQINKTNFYLAEKVVLQRMMRYLEGEGYDGFVYQNEYEDKGQNSYIVFRPEQVFHASEKSMEHAVAEKTPEQKSFLYGKEVEFFKKHEMLSPTQRIQNHLKRKLQKSR